ncbi:MAG: hypothetical protein M0015_16680 [Betaproteobacteria bacterium]|nr:hypothetical protein [Betaproteobacteria bacterium]
MTVNVLKTKWAETAAAPAVELSPARQRLAEVREAAARAENEIPRVDELLAPYRERMAKLKGLLARPGEVQATWNEETARWVADGCSGDAPDRSEELQAVERTAAAARTQISALDQAVQAILRGRAEKVAQREVIANQLPALALAVVAEEALALDRARVEHLRAAAELDARMVAAVWALEGVGEKRAAAEISTALKNTQHGDHHIEPAPGMQREYEQRWRRLVAALPGNPSARFEG